MRMTEIMTIQGIDCYEMDGTAYLKLDTVARGLGFTQEKNGIEYIRWETVNGYLKDFGFPKMLGKDDYIPENIFYRLAMKAKNAAAERFQAKVADEIIPAIRRTGRYELRNGLECAATRTLTIDDYLTAAKMIASCRNERLPYIFGILKDIGMEVKPVTPPLLEAKNRALLAARKEEEQGFRDLMAYFAENCETLGAFKEYGGETFTCIPTTTAHETAIKCKVNYRGFLTWARSQGYLKFDQNSFSRSVRIGKIVKHCICMKVIDNEQEVI